MILLFFTRFTIDCTLIILIYVDNGSSSFLIQCFIKQLSDIFCLKDLGKLHYFSGI